MNAGLQFRHFVAEFSDRWNEAEAARDEDSRTTLEQFAVWVESVPDLDPRARLRAWISQMRAGGVHPVAFQRDASVPVAFDGPLESAIETWTERLQMAASVEWRVRAWIASRPIAEWIGVLRDVPEEESDEGAISLLIQTVLDEELFEGAPEFLEAAGELFGRVERVLDRENIAETVEERGPSCAAMAPGMTQALERWVAAGHDDDHDWLCAKTVAALAAMGARDSVPTLVALLSVRGVNTGFANAHLAAVVALKALDARDSAPELADLLGGGPGERFPEPELARALANLLAAWRFQPALKTLRRLRDEFASRSENDASARTEVPALDDAISILESAC